MRSHLISVLGKMLSCTQKHVEYPQGCNMGGVTCSDGHCTCMLGEKLMTMKNRGNQR